MTQPNYFSRRWDWHNRVIEFEKKYDAIHRPTPQVVNDVNVDTLLDLLKNFKSSSKEVSHEISREVSKEVQFSPEIYKNHLYFAILRYGDLTEYLVSLVLDNSDDLYEHMEETHVFTTEQEAQQCFQDLKHLKRMNPPCAMAIFKDYLHN